MSSGITRASDYRTIQRWVQQVVTHPGGAAAGADSAAARTLIPIDAESIERVITPSQRMTGLERIGVYAGMYFARLIGALATDFPGLRHATGKQRFEQLARQFLIAHPSHEYTLALLGKGFPAYLRDEAEPFEHRGFIAELAALERTGDDIFHEPAHERVSPEALQAVPAHRWAEACFGIAPTLRLLEFRYPVNPYLRAVLDGKPIDIPPPRRTWVAVYRLGYSVDRMDLDHAQYITLSALVAGRTLGEAIEAAAGDEGVDALAGKLGGWFEAWSAATFFTSVSLRT